MFPKPNFSYLKQSESLQYLSDIAKLCQQSNIAAIAAPLQKLVDHNSELSQTFKQDKGSDLTKLLIKYDQRRDDAIVCIRMTTLAYGNHYNTNKRQAATQVLKTIDRYGKSLHRMNYQAETSTLFNLYEDLKSASLAPAVELLNMTDVLDEMNNSNTLFNETFLNRVQETVATKQIATGHKIQSAIASFRTLLQFITASNIINPSDELDNLLKQINVLTIKYNNMVKTRAGNKSEEQEIEIPSEND